MMYVICVNLNHSLLQLIAHISCLKSIHPHEKLSSSVYGWLFILSFSFFQGHSTYTCNVRVLGELSYVECELTRGFSIPNPKCFCNFPSLLVWVLNCNSELQQQPEAEISKSYKNNASVTSHLDRKLKVGLRDFHKCYFYLHPGFSDLFSSYKVQERPFVNGT